MKERLIGEVRMEKYQTQGTALQGTLTFVLFCFVSLGVLGIVPW